MVASTSSCKSDFDYFKENIYVMFPSVTKLRIKNNLGTMEPIEYNSEYKECAIDYPSTICWCIDTKYFEYAPVPIIRKIKPTYFFGLFRGRTYEEIDYSTAQTQALFVIKLSVEGLSESDINDRLDYYLKDNNYDSCKRRLQ